MLPDGVVGGPLQHSHAHLLTMARFRGEAEDGSDLEVIVTTYPRDPIGEHGERLDRDGEAWPVPGARSAIRRDQVTQLDIDPAVPPVSSIVVVATRRIGGSICLVVHHPLDTPSTSGDAVVESFELDRAEGI